MPAKVRKRTEEQYLFADPDGTIYQCSPSFGPNLFMGQNNSEVNPMRTSPRNESPPGQQDVVREPPKRDPEQPLRGPSLIAIRTLIGTYFCYPGEVFASGLLCCYFGP